MSPSILAAPTINPPAQDPGSARRTGSARVEWVDTAKGLGIFLVVLGHTYRGLLSGGIMGKEPAGQAADAWIYSFHMPLFFFVSGMFLPGSAAKPWGTFAADKFRTIAYPYFLWSLLTIAVKAGLGRLANQPRDFGDLPYLFYAPIEQFWFLYVLFIAVMALGYALHCGVPPWILVVATAILHLDLIPALSIPKRPLIELRENLFYVALGAWFGSRGDVPSLSRIPTWGLIVAAVAGLAMPTAFAAGLLNGWDRARLLVAIAGIAGTFALSIAADRTGRDGVLKLLGRHSLEIFVAHTLVSAAVRIGLVKVGKITDPTTHMILGTIAGLIVPLMLVGLARRTRFPYAFTLPRRPRAAA